MKMPSVSRVIDAIVQSPEDAKAYRALELRNGMRVVLVSDASAEKGAASLEVAAGSMMDPRRLPGLAHFCEHMLFMGTTKYPSENDYNEYLQSHGGQSNAYTADDHTNYHFDVAAEHLEGAVDRFSQFFVAPLFTESATEREVRAVDSEHRNNVKSDPWRLNQVQKTLADPQHDYSNFGTGNIDTLLNGPKLDGVDTRAELLRFHQSWYSANLMCLCVVGSHTLDQLQSTVLDYFAHVAAIDGVQKREWPQHPYGTEQLAKAVKVVPVKDTRSLHVTFPMPDLQPQHRTQPAGYISHLLGHEGAGSLLSELKRRGWVNALSAGYGVGARGFGWFSVDMDLSIDGLANVEEILKLMYEYIGMLRDEGVQKWIFDECADLNETFFRFAEKSTSLSLAKRLASDAAHYDLERVLVGPYRTDEYKPELITDALRRLAPRSMNYAVTSKTFDGDEGMVTEQWYGTRYSVKQIDEGFLSAAEESMSNWRTSGHFKLPERNEFIPTNFDRVKRDDRHKDIGKYSVPSLSHDDDWLRVWHKADDEFGLPKAVALFKLASPLWSPVAANCASLLQMCLADALTEYVYGATLAGLSAQWDVGKTGAQLTVTGYSDKLPVLATRMAEKLRDYEPDTQRFAVLKELHVRNLRNFAKEQPYQHAIYYNNMLLTHVHWSKEELLHSAQKITVEDIRSYKEQLLSTVHVETLAHGNCTKESAVSMSRAVCAALRASASRPLFDTELQLDNEHAVPPAEWHVLHRDNATHSNSAVECIYQAGVQTPRGNATLDLLAQVMAEKAFDELRTKEQLGYIVFSGGRRANGAQSLRLIVQGERDPRYVEARVEAFLRNFRQNVLAPMSAGEFEQHKAALATRALERPKKLYRLATRHWAEILSRNYSFDRDVLETGELSTVTKAELESFFDAHVASGSPQRRKLTTRIFGSGLGGADADKAEWIDDAKAVRIERVGEFKSSTGMYGRPAPYSRVRPPGVAAEPMALPAHGCDDGAASSGEEDDGERSGRSDDAL